MDGFNSSQSGEQQRETSVGKGIIFAIIGMIVGVIPYIVALGLLDWSFAWIGGIIVGAGISVGWHIGKGPDNALRKLVVIVLSVVAAVIAVWIGASIYLYRMGLGRDFAAAVRMTGDFFVSNIEDVFGDFSRILDDDFLILRHFVFIIAFSIGTAWRGWQTRNNDDLEVDNGELEDLSTIDTSSTNTDMDDLLNQDVPTLNVDENWNCPQCGATNRSIVETCEYCGGSK